MKTNAPEKIYLQVCGDCPAVDCEGCKFEDLEDNITWCRDKIFEKDIEYTRTDTFIDKAHEWLRRNLSNYCDVTREDFELFIDDFRKYLKEE